MRVLVVTTDFPPHRCGGYELQCAATVEHLRAAGHEVRVLTSARGPATRAERRSGVIRELIRFPSTPHDSAEVEAWRAERFNRLALERQLDELRPDVVSWWRMGQLSLSLVDRVRRRGIPAVGVVCDPWMLDGPERDPWIRLDPGRMPDLCGVRWLFVSESLRGRMPDVGEDTAVVHSGVDLDGLPLRPRRAWRGRLAYVGRLSAPKGVDVAIAALAQLPGMTLDVIGEGDPEPYVRLAAEVGVRERVDVRPALPADRVAAAYFAADAVLFPARRDEPFGLVPLEAMACGIPVVATGTGGSAEYLRDGANALLAARDDPTAVARAVQRLASDPALRERLRTAGRATAEEHPLEASCAAIRAELERAAAGGTARVGEPAPA